MRIVETLLPQNFQVIQPQPGAGAFYPAWLRPHNTAPWAWWRRTGRPWPPGPACCRLAAVQPRGAAQAPAATALESGLTSERILTNYNNNCIMEHYSDFCKDLCGCPKSAKFSANFAYLHTLVLVRFRVAAKQHLKNFAKHEILTKLFRISRNFAKIKSLIFAIFS